MGHFSKVAHPELVRAGQERPLLILGTITAPLRLLAKMGYTNVISLDGGWRAIEVSGLPVEKGRAGTHSFEHQPGTLIPAGG